MQHDTSDILFSAFKNTFVMKGFICFTDIFIYKQFSCQEFIKINFCNKYWQFPILFDQTIKTRCHMTRLILSPFLVTNQSAQAVNGCHQIIFFCNVIKLNIFYFRSKMMCHFKSLIFDCFSFTEGLITFLSTTDREAPALNRRSSTSVPPQSAAARWSGVSP